MQILNLLNSGNEELSDIAANYSHYHCTKIIIFLLLILYATTSKHNFLFPQLNLCDLSICALYIGTRFSLSALSSHQYAALLEYNRNQKFILEFLSFCRKKNFC